eukprot:GHVU01143259.1.p1 GENE.GHVU01143259.1~~GHVU01143259.1.p1  ORF type:complete len:204 (+),score=39.35 GHVU01143259.1:279-890(+)
MRSEYSVDEHGQRIADIGIIVDSARQHYGDVIDDYVESTGTDGVGPIVHLDYIPGGMTSIIQMGDVCWHKDFKKALLERTGRLRVKKREMQPGAEKPVFTVRRGEMISMMEAVVKQLTVTWTDAYNPRMYNYIRKTFQLCGFGMPLPGEEENNRVLFTQHMQKMQSCPVYKKLANAAPVEIDTDANQWEDAPDAYEKECEQEL